MKHTQASVHKGLYKVFNHNSHIDKNTYALSQMPASPNDILLPDNVKPLHYSLFIAKDINLHKISIKTLQGDVHAAAFKFIQQEKVVAELPICLNQGERVQLRLIFDGELHRSSSGYFCCQDGRDVRYAATQFEVSYQNT